jgi:uncharacterized protein (TIGR02246 family)
MKQAMIRMGVLCVAVLLLPVCAPPPEQEIDLKAEEEAIRKFIDEFIVAYNNRDGEAMAGMTDETLMTLGSVFEGRETIEEFYTNYFRLSEDTQTNILEEICLEFVTPEVALYQVRIEFANRPPDADGNPQPDQELFDTNVFVKRDGRWLRKGVFLRPIE